jgi:RNA polymerase sigma-70 factor, ECF subfamily
MTASTSNCSATADGMPGSHDREILRQARLDVHSRGMAHTPGDNLRALLLRFWRRGDAGAMDSLVRRTRPKLLATARRIGAPQDAEDSVQAAYHALLRTATKPPEKSVRAWLLVAVVRIAFRRKALVDREKKILERLERPGRDLSPPVRAARGEERVLVRDEVVRLPARYRDVVVLHYFQGLKIAEVAQLIECPISTVTTRLQRARALLRGRLIPILHQGVMALPWMVQDVGLLLTGPVQALGVVMKTKVLVATVTMVVAAGVAGVAIGTVHNDRDQVPPVEPRSTRAQPARVAELEDALDAERRRSAELRGEIARTGRHPELEVEPEPDSGAPARPAAKPPALSESSHQAARDLGVSPPVLKKAHLAYVAATTGAADAEKRLQVLKRTGPEGFRALIALLRGGLSGPAFDGLFQAIWTTAMSGEERFLIETVDISKVHVWSRHVALKMLRIACTPVARDYLFSRLQHEEDPGLFLAAADALGHLKDHRALPRLEEKMRDKSFGSAARAHHVMAAAWKIGGEDAKRIFVDYLRRTDSDLQSAALGYLRMLDPESALREANALLAEPRRGTLAGDQLIEIKRMQSLMKETERRRKESSTGGRTR